MNSKIQGDVCKKIAAKIQKSIKIETNTQVSVTVSKYHAKIAYNIGNIASRYLVKYTQTTMENAIIELINVAIIPLVTNEAYVYTLNAITSDTLQAIKPIIRR